jgi:hypothetical protein
LHDGLPAGEQRSSERNGSRDPNRSKKSSRIRADQSALFQQAPPFSGTL